MTRTATIIFSLFFLTYWLQLNKTYTTSAYSINYPENWTLDASKQKADAILFFSPLDNANDNFSENVNVIEQNLAGQNIDLPRYKQITESQISALQTSGKLISSTIEKSSNGSRYYVEYLMTTQGNNVHIKSLCYMKNEMAYLITFTTKTETFDRYNKIGSEIIESFKFK